MVEVPEDKLWGAQTQRSLEHFSIGKDLIPREMITAYATLKKAAAIANHNGDRLDDQRYKLIVQVRIGYCLGDQSAVVDHELQLAPARHNRGVQSPHQPCARSRTWYLAA